jgi:hypothetical protein
MSSAPAGSLLAVPSAQGNAMVVVAEDDLWLINSDGAPATRVAGPLYSTIGPSGFYGEVDWAGTFAWSLGAGPRQGPTLLDELSDLSNQELP